jgi:hypothetical protein
VSLFSPSVTEAAPSVEGNVAARLEIFLRQTTSPLMGGHDAATAMAPDEVGHGVFLRPE